MRATVVTACRYVVGKDGTVWSTGAFDYRAIARYLAIFDTVVVIGRVSKATVVEGLSLASGPRVTFVSTGRSARVLGRTGSGIRTVSRAIGSCDWLILRVPSVFALVAALVAAILGKPVITEVLNSSAEAFRWHHSLVSRRLAWMLHICTKVLVRRSRAVTYVTESYLQKNYPTSRPALGSSDAWLEPPVRLPSSRESKSYRLGTIGQLDGEVKGFDLLVKALSTPTVPEHVHAYILGRGEHVGLMSLARRLGVADRVHLVGTLPRGEAVNTWLRGIDCYVQPSRSEGLPRSILEAMNLSLPVIGSDAGGIEELIDPSAAFRVGDVTTLAELIARATRDHEWIRSLRRRSVTTAVHHSRSTQQPMWETFIRNVVFLPGGSACG